MSLIVRWIEEGLPPHQAQTVLNGFFELVQWSKLNHDTLSTCNSDFGEALQNLQNPTQCSKSFQARQIEILSLVSEWIKTYLKSHPSDDTLVSGFLLARSYD